ncbi:MAG: hypothetical protein JSU65_05225 [Candidatus Zixiibacteriota bacterium]|nr:MAG: hypothetical protein JSU65_05225 [candidate division Zixibacteria bacterium]
MRNAIGTTIACGVILCGSMMAQPPTGPSLKSPQAATNLSLFGTLAPVGLGIMMTPNQSYGFGLREATCLTAIVGGIVVGPGLGHAYAGNYGRLWVGMGLRLLAVGGAMTVMALTWNDSDSETGAAAGFASLVLLGGSAIADIAAAGRSARNYNEKHGLTGFTITPTYFAEHDACGLTFALNF